MKPIASRIVQQPVFDALCDMDQRQLLLTIKQSFQPSISSHILNSQVLVQAAEKLLMLSL